MRPSTAAVPSNPHLAPSNHRHAVAGAGKSASGLKEVADSCPEGLAEVNVNADELKSAARSVLDTSASDTVPDKEKQA